MNISSKVSFGNGCTCPNCTARDGWYTRAQKELAKISNNAILTL